MPKSARLGGWRPPPNGKSWIRPWVPKDCLLLVMSEPNDLSMALTSKEGLGECVPE